ncbi:MAG: hypothetical protein AB1465_01240 [Patescibacteria group bacterium]
MWDSPGIYYIAFFLTLIAGGMWIDFYIKEAKMKNLKFPVKKVIGTAILTILVVSIIVLLAVYRNPTLKPVQTISAKIQTNSWVLYL